jgi:hypothetical protein
MNFKSRGPKTVLGQTCPWTIPCAAKGHDRWAEGFKLPNSRIPEWINLAMEPRTDVQRTSVRWCKMEVVLCQFRYQYCIVRVLPENRKLPYSWKGLLKKSYYILQLHCAWNFSSCWCRANCVILAPLTISNRIWRRNQSKKSQQTWASTNWLYEMCAFLYACTFCLLLENYTFKK